MNFNRLEQFFLKTLSTVFSKIGHKDVVSKELDYWRERIVLTIFLIFVVIGLFVCIACIWVATMTGDTLIATVNVLSYLGFLYCLFSKRCTFRIRAFILLLIVYCIGITLLFTVNPNYALIWLFCFSIIASLLFGFRAACLALGCNFLTLVVAGIFIYYGRIEWDPAGTREMLGWIVISINFMLLNSIVAAAIAILVNRLTTNIEKERMAVEQLSREHVLLQNEIRQRKKAQHKQKVLQEKLKQDTKMKTIGLMAGGVAHDLNNILSGIVTYPELLLSKLPKDSGLRESVKIIRDSGSRAAEVVDNLLTISRDASAARRICDLNSLVNEFIRTPECKKIQNDHQGVELVVDLDPELWNLNCSPMHIRKCLMNLVLNGCEATTSGGRVTISGKNETLEGLLSNNLEAVPGDYVVLIVSDTGSGIIEKDLENIFEPFYTRKVMGKSGSGLGLAVVWNSVQQHKGTIVVESDSNGTVFKLYFPATKGKAFVGTQTRVDFRELFGNGEKILVVDDELLQRKIGINLLQSLKYECVAVSSGEEAIDYLQKHSVDLVLLDMVMEPGLNGRQTYEQIIADNPAQKAIIVSGFSFPEEMEKIRELGVTVFVKKPYSIAELGEAVKKIL